MCMLSCFSHLTLQTCGLSCARLLCPGDSLGKNTGVGCHELLQGVFPTQGLNLCLLCLLLCLWVMLLWHQRIGKSPENSLKVEKVLRALVLSVMWVLQKIICVNHVSKITSPEQGVAAGAFQQHTSLSYHRPSSRGSHTAHGGTLPCCWPCRPPWSQSQVREAAQLCSQPVLAPQRSGWEALGSGPVALARALPPRGASLCPRVPQLRPGCVQPVCIPWAADSLFVSHGLDHCSHVLCPGAASLFLLDVKSHLIPFLTLQSLPLLSITRSSDGSSFNTTLRVWSSPHPLPGEDFPLLYISFCS